MGKIGRERVERVLAWPHQREAYLEVFDELAVHAATPATYARATGSDDVRNRRQPTSSRTGKVARRRR